MITHCHINQSNSSTQDFRIQRLRLARRHVPLFFYVLITYVFMCYVTFVDICVCVYACEVGFLIQKHASYIFRPCHYSSRFAHAPPLPTISNVYVTYIYVYTYSSDMSVIDSSKAAPGYRYWSTDWDVIFVAGTCHEGKAHWLIVKTCKHWSKHVVVHFFGTKFVILKLQKL